MTKGNGLPCVRCGTSEWYKDGACKECQRERGRRWQQSNPDKVAERDSRWAQKNPDKVAERSRRWARNNPDKMAESSRRWNEANREKVAEKHRRWQQENPERVSAHTNRRRTRKTEAGGSFTAAEWKALCEYYGNKCLKCGRNDMKLAADHILPVSKGGSSNIENIQPLCKPCNSKKKDKHIDYRPDAGPIRWLQAKLFG